MFNFHTSHFDRLNRKIIISCSSQNTLTLNDGHTYLETKSINDGELTSSENRLSTYSAGNAMPCQLSSLTIASYANACAGTRENDVGSNYTNKNIKCIEPNDQMPDPAESRP